MRLHNHVLKTLALLAWSAISFGQQQGTPPPAQPPPAPRTETPAPPPAAEREPAPAPREGGAAEDADEREFIPTEELAPDAAITFPVNI